MPKRTICRPGLYGLLINLALCVIIYFKDGATLQDVYESKKEDCWGKIIKAQYRDDVRSIHEL
jgi:hypothetical protein